MERWRYATRDHGMMLPAAEAAELEQLIEDELAAAGQRAASMLRDMQR